MLPRDMVTAARIHRKLGTCQLSALPAMSGPAQTNPRTRSKATKPAALGKNASKAATHVGAPWYTSGAYWWKGTAVILKLSPAVTMTRATSLAALSALG